MAPRFRAGGRRLGEGRRLQHRALVDGAAVALPRHTQLWGRPVRRHLGGRCRLPPTSRGLDPVSHALCNAPRLPERTAPRTPRCDSAKTLAGARSPEPTIDSPVKLGGFMVSARRQRWMHLAAIAIFFASLAAIPALNHKSAGLSAPASAASSRYGCRMTEEAAASGVSFMHE